MDDSNPVPLISTEGIIDHPDGTVEFDGLIFEIDWAELDPPEGSPDAEEIPHEEVMAEMYRQLASSAESR